MHPTMKDSLCVPLMMLSCKEQLTTFEKSNTKSPRMLAVRSIVGATGTLKEEVRKCEVGRLFTLK